jgi:hypothetical protein
MGVQLSGDQAFLFNVRRNQTGRNDRDFGVFGREVYNYFATDGRFITNYPPGESPGRNGLIPTVTHRAGGSPLSRT